MYNVFDMSSILWTCLLAGTDPKAYKVEFNGKTVNVNTSEYGYENAMNSMVATLNQNGLTPMQAILVFEGMNSKAQRLVICKGYKDRVDKCPEMYHEFQQLRDKILTTWRNLGAIACSQDFAEGDDTCAWFAQNTRSDLIISTNDNDLTALNGTNRHGATITVSVNGVMGVNRYGDFDFKYITLYKALVGDTSDKIPGIVGFGPKAWQALWNRFGTAGCDELLRLAELGSLDELALEADADKQIKQLYEGADNFIMSYRLAKLRPEWVNTFNYPLQWFPGMVKPSSDYRTKRWGQHSKLVTHAVWDKFQEWALELLAKESWLSLDIETSTPDESDDWLAAQDKPDGVDTIGSELTGMSLTFGPNKAYTVYIPVDHKDTDNVPPDKLRIFLEQLFAMGPEIVIHNTLFEGTVLYNTWGSLWKDNGYNGLIPNWLDTKLEASYVDENGSLGLKSLSKRWLDYDQTEYNAVTTIEGVQFKMRELSAQHVLDYACDDTITTAALHNFFRLFMSLEGTYDVYKQVEIGASYLHCQSYIHGTKISVGRLKSLEAEDEAIYQEAERVLHAYLISKSWEGSLAPTVSSTDPASIKAAYLQITGKELKTAFRLLDKIYALMPDQPALVDLFKANDYESINKLMALNFKAAPKFNPGSPKQMATLLYEVMGLPVKVYNQPTDAMKKAGILQGSPKTDALAMAYAIAGADAETKEILLALQTMKMVITRKSLYYKPYPYFVHWKTGRIHSSHNQCATNTRRASTSSPNLQQVAKHEKIEGFDPKIREVYIPHKPGAVIVSMDFMAQELRVIADYSQDQNMLDCFIGDNLKDMHALTGLGVAIEKEPAIEWSYELFVQILGDHSSPMFKLVKECRTLGKKVNFTTEYGAMAPKLAATMLISEDVAQAYINAKEAAFPRASEWKREVIEEAKRVGYVKTKLGAVRHLSALFNSPDRYISSKAERQAVNFKIQSSSAEITKLAEGRMWDAKLEQRFDCEIIAPVHDEVFASCAIEDLYEFIPAMHKCMEGAYADMTVPLLSSISFGKSFGPKDQIEIGEKATKEAIDKGLEEMSKNDN